MADEDRMLQQDPDDEDEIFTAFAKEIAVRKCKMLQRREKLRLMIEAKGKLKQELKASKGKAKYINDEKDVIHQINARILNINGLHESRSSLEEVLCDLRNQVSEEITKTKMKSVEFKAHIQDAAETWESYEKMYNELPLAKKKQEFIVVLKNFQIKIKITLTDVADMKYKIKLRNEVRDKMFHNWGVNVANTYFSIKEKIAKKSALLNKKGDLEKRIEDMKAGKNNKDLSDKFRNVTKPLQTSGMKTTYTSTLEVLKFQIPHFQISSPPSESRLDSSTNWSSLFKWESLLGSSSFAKPISKPNEHISSGQTITGGHSENKRKITIETKDLKTNQTKKIKTPVELQSVQNKTKHKDNLKPQGNIYSLSNISKLMSSFSANKKAKTNITIEKGKVVNNHMMNNMVVNDIKVQQKQEYALDSVSSVIDNGKQPEIYHQTTTQEEKELQIVQDTSDISQTQLDTIAMTMDPNSPPDVIPVENNSQPLSQGITTSNISGKSQALSDYTSPIELDEAAKLAYQRIAAESPGFVYTRGPEQKKAVTPQAPQNTVHSQYFSNVSSPQSQILNTQTLTDEFQTMPYSPPANHSFSTGSEKVLSPQTGQIEFQAMPFSPPANHSPSNGTKSVLSPPTGQIGNFQNSLTMPLFGKPAEENKSSGGGFGGFTFDAPKKKSSFFSLF